MLVDRRRTRRLEHADIVLGGNIYDGHLNLDMRANYNGLDRGLVLLGVHPKPERVLMIGLSAGAWARIVSSLPTLRNSSSSKSTRAISMSSGTIRKSLRFSSIPA